MLIPVFALGRAQELLLILGLLWGLGGLVGARGLLQEIWAGC